MTFEELFKTHSGYVSDKWESYLPVYEYHLSPFKERAIDLLEIGVQNGGSLNIWSRYFSKARSIIGCDINPQCCKLRYSDPRISVVVGDINRSATVSDIKCISPYFDIIVDDGSHYSSDIIESFQCLYLALKPGGVYIVEDLHCSYWKAFEGGLAYERSAVEFFKKLIDIINYQSWGEAKAKAPITAVEENWIFQGELSNFRSIQSIHFYNSLCIVIKGFSPHNTLGGRLVVGNEATVFDSLPKSGVSLNNAE